MANLVSLSRLLSIPCMLVAAELGSIRIWVGLFAYALLSDAIDGPIARALGTVSARGASIDSIADCALYLTMPVVALLLFPWLRAQETPVIVVITLGYSIPIACGWVKFRRLTSYHTIAARAAGVLLSSTFLVLLATRVAWPLHAAAIVLLLSAAEEIAITLALPAWRADIPSLRRALRDLQVVPVTTQPLTAGRQST
ncbi:MAG: CDP-alcohol phosphatidyltransferase family protein [Gemmatimonadaceae bacterium]